MVGMPEPPAPPLLSDQLAMSCQLPVPPTQPADVLARGRVDRQPLLLPMSMELLAIKGGATAGMVVL